MALTISTGFVVDDAIVMIENIARYIEEGEPPFEAALKGAKQIGFTIVSLTVSLVAVLIPLLFMGGLIGRLFREFAVTLAIAIGVSAVLSLTLTRDDVRAPAAAASADGAPRAALRAGPSAASTAMLALLRPRPALGARPPAHHAAGRRIATVALTVLLAVVVPKGFFPQQDTGLIIGVSEAAPDVSFPRMMELQRALADVVRADPDVAAWRRSSAPTAPTPTTNSGRISITLQAARRARRRRRRDHRAPAAASSPRSTASRSTCRRCRTCRSTAASAARSTSTRSRTPTPTSSPRGRRELLARAARRCPSCATSPATSRPAGCELALDDRSRHRLAPRRHAAGHRRHALRRLRPAAGLDHLHPAQPVPRDPRGEARVPAGRPTRSTQLYVRSTTRRRRCRCRAFARFETARRAARDHPPGAVPGGDALVQPGARRVARRRGRRDRRSAERASACRPACTPSSRAPRRRSATSLASEPLLILAALITVYIVLGVLYESYIHPITILSTLPSAGVGRAAGAHRLPDRVQRHRAHRHHAAHRHREEERDHDDRLRARGGARPEAVARARRSTRRACCASGRS